MRWKFEGFDPWTGLDRDGCFLRSRAKMLVRCLDKTVTKQCTIFFFRQCSLNCSVYFRRAGFHYLIRFSFPQIISR